MEQRYHDAQDVPGYAAGGGGDWKEQATTDNTLKRARSPEDEGDGGRGVRISQLFPPISILYLPQLQDPRPKVEEQEHDANRM